MRLGWFSWAPRARQVLRVPAPGGGWPFLVLTGFWLYGSNPCLHLPWPPPTWAFSLCLLYEDTVVAFRALANPG